jgi:hypothetical protein
MRLARVDYEVTPEMVRTGVSAWVEWFDSPETDLENSCKNDLSGDGRGKIFGSESEQIWNIWKASYHNRPQARRARILATVPPSAVTPKATKRNFRRGGG